MEVISAFDFSKIIHDENTVLVDVRTKGEFDFANIGGKLIPLDELEERYAELDKNSNIYCLCHHGVRSMHAANFLLHQGFKNIWNITGGIHAWSLSVDSGVPQY